MKYLLLLALALGLNADTHKTFVMLQSLHHTADHIRDGYNNNNFGGGYEYTHDSGFGVNIGGYYNSYYKPTAFVGVYYEYRLFKDLTISTSCSFATGYKKAKGMTILPIPMIGIQYKFIRIVTNMPLAEAVDKGSITNLQLVYTF